MLPAGGADKDWDWKNTWKAMEKVYKENPDKVKAIGVSNVSVEYFKELLKVAEVTPAVNQIELHPYVRMNVMLRYILMCFCRSCNQAELVDYCRSKGIALTAYSPLGSQDSPLHDNPVIKKIADKHGVSTANILVSLQANKPDVTGKSEFAMAETSFLSIVLLHRSPTYALVLAKSVTPQRVIDNLKLVDLSSEEIDELTSLEKKSPFRVCKPWWTGHGDLGFEDCRKEGPPKKP